MLDDELVDADPLDVDDPLADDVVVDDDVLLDDDAPPAPADEELVVPGIGPPRLHLSVPSIAIG